MSYFDLDKLDTKRKDKNRFPMRKSKLSDSKFKNLRFANESETIQLIKKCNYDLSDKRVKNYNWKRNFELDLCSPVIMQLRQKSKELLSPFSNLPTKHPSPISMQPVSTVSIFPSLIPRSRTRPRFRYSPLIKNSNK